MAVAETESKHMLSPLCPVNGTLSGFLAPAAYLCLIICSVSISICLAWRSATRLHSARFGSAPATSHKPKPTKHFIQTHQR